MTKRVAGHKTDGEHFKKVQFYDPDIGYENLWALPLTTKRYQLENIPFFVYGVSFHDVVTALPDKQGVLQFQRVVEQSGNRTLRARSEGFIRNPRRRNQVIADLRKLGTEVEELRSRLLAINVPPIVDLGAVTNYLTERASVSWEYGNPAELNQ